MKKFRWLSVALAICIMLGGAPIGASGHVYAKDNDNENQETIQDETQELPGEEGDNGTGDDPIEEQPTPSVPVTKEEKKLAAKKAVNIKNPSLKVDAKYALLMDAQNGKVCYQKKALEHTPSASTSKLITAIAACEIFGSKDKLKVGNELKMVAWDASRAGFAKGEKMSLKQALSGLLLPSGCDAAYIIAVNGGRKLAGNRKLSDKKAVKKFMDYTNKIAFEIGAVNSNFITPDGYHASGHYTCAYDMALIGKKAMEYKTICDITKKSFIKTKLSSGQTKRWTNTNALVNKKSEFYMPNCIGLKTGTTSKAGACLVAAVKRDGKQYIAVILKGVGDGRFADASKLLKYGLKLPKTSKRSGMLVTDAA